MIYIVLIIVLILVAYKKYKNYTNTTYYKLTQNSPITVWFDTGLLGEYLIYNWLKDIENKDGKFLFNLYLPKEDGETTEIDVLLITNRGLFVFESKNYSGWIFGDDKQKNWTQTLPSGKGRSHKEYFYNPIFQNKGHISNLKRILGEEIPFYSIITFSERCTLKKVPEDTEFIKVIKRDDVLKTVANIYDNTQPTLTNEEIDEIYNKLKIYSQASNQIKKEHIDNIRMKYK